MTRDVIVSDRGEEAITQESQPRAMKEGDYLRRGVVLDDISDDDNPANDDDTVKSKSGCLPRPASAPAAHRRDSETTHHSKKLSEKLFKWLRPPAGGSGRHSPPCRGTARHQRKFMRVVKDEQAPPPEHVADNPNIICRYSQEYLTRHYAEVQARRGHVSSESSSSQRQHRGLPYTTSGHTILKKSSTDPTSDHSGAVSTSLKHATFCDVVTVVDSDAGDIHEERLRESDDASSDELDSVEGSPPSQSGFFLAQADPESGPADEVERSESCPAVRPDDVVSDVVKDVCDSVGLMNIFSTAATMELEPPEVSAQSPDEPRRKTSGSLPTTKHVKLVELMAQMRADDDAERS